MFDSYKNYNIVNVFCVLHIINLSDENYNKDIHSNIIINFANNFCKNDEELFKFLQFMTKFIKNNDYAFNMYNEKKAYRFLLKEVEKNNISLIEVFIKCIKESSNWSDLKIYYGLFIVSMEIYKKKTKENKNNVLFELLISTNAERKIFDTNFKYHLLNYLLKTDIYFTSEEFFKLMEENNNKYELLHNPKFNYKSPNLSTISIFKQKNTEIYCEMIINIYKKYIEQNIIELNNNLLNFLIKTNIYENFIKIYDNLLMKLLDKKPELINKDLVHILITNKNFYVLEHVLNNKYILLEEDIELIFKHGLCVDEIFDLIFANYLEKSEETFKRWFSNHKQDFEHISKFGLKIDDSYLDIFYDNYENNNHYTFDLTGKIKSLTSINPKKMEFYDSFLKIKKRSKFDEEKVEKLLKKYKKYNCKIDKICIENLLRAQYDELAEDLINKYKVDINPEKIVLLSNDYHMRKKYLELMKKK